MGGEGVDTETSKVHATHHEVVALEGDLVGDNVVLEAHVGLGGREVVVMMVMVVMIVIVVVIRGEKVSGLIHLGERVGESTEDLTLLSTGIESAFSELLVEEDVEESEGGGGEGTEDEDDDGGSVVPGVVTDVALDQTDDKRGSGETEVLERGHRSISCCQQRLVHNVGQDRPQRCCSCRVCKSHPDHQRRRRDQERLFLKEE